jgi:hypothetical protein
MIYSVSLGRLLYSTVLPPVSSTALVLHMGLVYYREVHGGHPSSHQPAFPPHLSTTTFHLFIYQPSLYTSVQCPWRSSVQSSTSLSPACICPQQLSIYSSISLLYTHLYMATIHSFISQLSHYTSVHSGHLFSHQPAFTPHLSTATLYLFICQPSLYASVHGNHPLSIVSISFTHLSTPQPSIQSASLYPASVHSNLPFIHLSAFFIRICPWQQSTFNSQHSFYASIHNNLPFIHLSSFFSRICPWQTSIHSPVRILCPHLSKTTIHSFICRLLGSCLRVPVSWGHPLHLCVRV